MAGAAGGFMAGAIVAKLVLDKSGWSEQVKAIEKDMDSLERRGVEVGKAWATFGKTFGAVGAAISTAVMGMVVKTSKIGEEIYDLSLKTGVSARDLSSLKLAAEESGSSLEGLATGFKFLSKSIVAGKNDMDEGKAALTQLGVASVDAAGKVRPMKDVLYDVAARFQAMPDGAEKSALAIKLFGRSGSELIPLLDRGASGLEEFVKVAERLGIVFSDQDALAAHEFGDKLVELKESFNGLVITLGRLFMPVAESFVKMITGAVASVTAGVKSLGTFGEVLGGIVPTFGLLATAVGAACVGIGSFIKLLAFASAALGTSSAALMQSVTAWTAAAAAVAYYIMVLGQLDDAKARQRESEVQLAEQQGRGISKLMDAAIKAHKTTAWMDEQIDKYRKYGDAFILMALKGAKAGEMGPEIAQAMSEIAEENVEAWRKLHPEVDTYGKDIADLLKKYDQLSRTKVQETLAATEQDLERLKASSEATPGAIAAATAKIKELKEALYGPSATVQGVGEKLDALKARLKGLMDEWSKAAGVDFMDFSKWKQGGMALEVDTETFDQDLAAATTRMEEAGQQATVLGSILGDEISGASAKASQGVRDFMKSLTEGGKMADVKNEIAAINLVLSDQGTRSQLTAGRIKELEDRLKELKGELADSTPWGRFLQGALEAFNRINGMLQPIIQQAQQNKEIAIENEYKSRLDYINRTITDEEQKQKAITALEAEYEIKKSKARAAAARTQKAASLAQAIINTAEAVTEALAQGGFILGIPWAAIVGALGAVQIAMIAAQPIPMKEGGQFQEPTLLQNVLVGEAGPEYVLPEKKLVRIVRDAVATPRAAALAMAGGVAGGPQVSVYFNSPLVAGQGISRADLQRAGEELKEIVLGQLARVGRGGL